MNLFALSDDPANRVVRIPLQDLVRDEVIAVFAQQEADFKNRTEREIAFDGHYKPDRNECLYIDNFDDIDGLEGAVINAVAVPVIPPSTDALANVKALFVGRVANDGTLAILLQSFEKRRIISTEGMLTLFFDAHHYTKVNTIGLTIDNKLSAILENGRLKFFSFYVARLMFDLTQYYITATDQEVNEFASSRHVHVHDLNRFMDNSDTWVRRKIALIRQSGVLDEVAVSHIKRVAAEFDVRMVTEIKDGLEVIRLPDEKAQLKSLLRFLDEDYYRSSLRALPHLTNSKIKL